MKYDPAKHHRRSIRLRAYDYSQAGAYYVTICTQNRQCLFGDVVDEQMRLNEAGRMAADAWQWLALQYDYVELDEWVVMPNHLHGIVIITDECRGGSRTAPTEKRKPIGRLIGALKTVSSKQINIWRQTEGAKFWQRNYWERVIRNEEDLNLIREYIHRNPFQWKSDKLHPENA